MDHKELKNTTISTLLTLETEDGINASGREEVFGCLFGRDSAITILKILRAVANPSFTDGLERERLLAMCRKTLITLVSLQGKEVNVESGEEPGKFIHEYRKEKYEHLTNSDKPWFLYPEGVVKNYDSIDATMLILIAIYRYWEVTRDDIFLIANLDAVEKGLNWILEYGDHDHDFLVEYEFKKERIFGGLAVQSWTDSVESLLDEYGRMPMYPIAPIEVQGYAWLAVTLWFKYFAKHMDLTSKEFVLDLQYFAENIKKKFNPLCRNPHAF